MSDATDIKCDQVRNDMADTVQERATSLECTAPVLVMSEMLQPACRRCAAMAI